ncbi:MAG: hypothetical protein OQK35_07660 [Alphaproteobacteria bacterium]|nr:hypothetical protein [Rhodospirillales bacterium]MCW9046193.1 hypothetical protein [Alphaproteobacteria bacterium]
MPPATQVAVSSIEGIGDSINRINKTPEVILEIVDKQGNTASEITTNMEQSASGTRDAPEHISGVANGARKTGTLANKSLAATQQSTHNSIKLEIEA